MKKKIRAVLIMVLCAGICKNIIAQDNGSVYTLQNSITIALANNIPVKQNDLQVQTASINYTQAKNNRLPNVAANIDYGISSGRSIDPFTNGYVNQQLGSSNATLSASVPVFKGFQLQRTIEQASLTLQAAKLENQQEKDNLTLNVILGFLQVMNNEDVLELTKKQAAVTQKQAERLDVLNTEGAIAPATFYDMKGQYATDQVAIVTAANTLELSKLALSQLMNVPYKKEMKLSREGMDTAIKLYAASSEQVYATAMEKLAMVKAADLRVKAASKAIQVAKADLYPILSLSGQLATNYSTATRNLTPIGVTDVTTTDYVIVGGNNSPVITKQTNYSSQRVNYFNQAKNNLGTFFGVNLQVPIFNGFQARSKIALAKVQEKNTAYVAENTRIQLQQAIEQAYLNMTSAYEKYQLLTEQAVAFAESFRAAEIRFNLGALNSVDYLIVKNNLDRTNLNLTIARYEYLLRTKVLDFYQGSFK